MELQKRVGRHGAGVPWEQQLQKEVAGPFVQLPGKDCAGRQLVTTAVFLWRHSSEIGAGRLKGRTCPHTGQVRMHPDWQHQLMLPALPPVHTPVPPPACQRARHL